MNAIFKHSPKSMFSRSFRSLLIGDRRNHGVDIRLWNDRDPRVDQSFFNGSVPGFVLSLDHSMVDWNVGFDMIFGSLPQMKRGVSVQAWYELIENFRRVSSREEKLHGDAVLPITDRNRVVFVSESYGRMVFTKLMSPVLDRVTGRVIGWNITLNINSVAERVKFFTDLNQKIQNSTKHARYIIGLDQIAQKSRVMHNAVERSINDLERFTNVLVLGALGAKPFIEEILISNPVAKVSIVDNDTEALRHLRHHLSHFGIRVKFVRRNICDMSIVPENRFDTAIVLWPKISSENLEKLKVDLDQKLTHRGQIAVISWLNDWGHDKFWAAVRRDLEELHEIDLIRWHIPIIEEKFTREAAIELNGGTTLAPGLTQSSTRIVKS